LFACVCEGLSNARLGGGRRDGGKEGKREGGRDLWWKKDVYDRREMESRQECCLIEKVRVRREGGKDGGGAGHDNGLIKCAFIHEEELCLAKSKTLG